MRGEIESASAAASAGSWNRRGARRTTPNGSVTALKVPKMMRIVASRRPSSAAYAIEERSTVPNTTSVVRRTSVTIPAIRNIRNDAAVGSLTRCPV